ncbi:MAG TPA: tetratricopeptide repeat protein [Acidimicrobiales bacterium]
MGTVFTDQWGAPLQARTPEGVALFDRAVDGLARLGGEPVADAEAAVAADPDLVLARLLGAYFALYGASAAGVAAARGMLADVESGPGPRGEREVLHHRAARSWADGDWVAATGALERALLHDPRDLVALKVAQDLCFFLGDQAGLLAVATRVLPAWTSDRPGWGYVQGILAFGLEESGDYRAAEGHARAALAANPADVWATHALAHVFEMEGNQQAGVSFLTETAGDWTPSYFAVHNWWHLALFELELGRVDAVLDIYDGPIRSKRSTEWLDIVDAAALLWRLSLFGVDITERVGRLADDIEPLLDSSVYVFNDWHAVMAFGLAGRADLVDRVIVEAHRGSVGTNRSVAERVGLSLLQGFASVADGRTERGLDLLFGARSEARAVGGSNAQRDVIDLTIMAAGARIGSRRLVNELASGRQDRKPTSVDATRALVEANSA